MKPRKPIRKVSKHRAGKNAQYRKAAKEFLFENGLPKSGMRCPIASYFYSLDNSLPLLVATQVHHMRGRTGNLLLDQRYWLAVSAEGHRWIHDHPEEARKHGWLCQPGEWGEIFSE